MRSPKTTGKAGREAITQTAPLNCPARTKAITLARANTPTLKAKLQTHQLQLDNDLSLLSIDGYLSSRTQLSSLGIYLRCPLHKHHQCTPTDTLGALLTGRSWRRQTAGQLQLLGDRVAGQLPAPHLLPLCLSARRGHLVRQRGGGSSS